MWRGLWHDNCKENVDYTCSSCYADLPSSSIWLRWPVSLKGNIINVEQGSFEILPTLPENLKVIFAQSEGVFGHISFQVRREKLQRALGWLKSHNPFYLYISISDEALGPLLISEANNYIL